MSEVPRRGRADTRAAERLELLVGALREIARCEPTRADVLATLVEQARITVDADHSAVFAPVADQIMCIAESGDVATVAGQTYAIGSTLAGRALISGHTLAGADDAEDGHLLPVDAPGYRVRSAVAVPLAHGDLVTAVLSVTSAQPRRFDEDDATVLTDLGTVAAARLSHATTLEHLRDREDALEVMYAERMAVTAARHAILADEAAAIAVCRVARELTGAALVSLFLPTGDGFLERAAWNGFVPDPLRLADDGRSVVAEVHRERQSRIVWDPSREPGLACEAVGALEHAVGTPVTGALYVPLIEGDDCAGVLVATMTEPLHARHPAMLGTLELLAGEAVIALQREDLVFRLAEQASTDALTGLANRRAWDTMLELELSRCRRTGRALCVALLDLDNFKAYNDEHGHPAGDALLVAVASAWRGQLRPTDALARYGGEEFALMMPDTTIADAFTVVEGLRKLVVSGQTVSAGLVAWAGTRGGPELVARADTALYAAKRTGRDRTEIG